MQRAAAAAAAAASAATAVTAAAATAAAAVAAAAAAAAVAAAVAVPGPVERDRRRPLRLGGVEAGGERTCDGGRVRSARAADCGAAKGDQAAEIGGGRLAVGKGGRIAGSSTVHRAAAGGGGGTRAKCRTMVARLCTARSCGSIHCRSTLLFNLLLSSPLTRKIKHKQFIATCVLTTSQSNDMATLRGRTHVTNVRKVM